MKHATSAVCLSALQVVHHPQATAEMGNRVQTPLRCRPMPGIGQRMVRTALANGEGGGRAATVILQCVCGALAAARRGPVGGFLQRHLLVGAVLRLAAALPPRVVKWRPLGILINPPQSPRCCSPPRDALQHLRFRPLISLRSDVHVILLLPMTYLSATRYW